ncbi:pilus assembly protein [Paracoccaceae bacterium Fryx2]|nr:pilus assembly protein [Paracoccaceae bacterium Fryx2]
MTASRAIARIWHCRSGTAAIEFAFVIGPLMLLMFGAIEVARLVWVRKAIDESAISGARCMGIKAAACATADHVDPVATKAHIRKQAGSWGLSLASSMIELDEAAGCGEPTGGFSSVIISYQFNSVLTLLTGPRLSFEACFPNQD